MTDRLQIFTTDSQDMSKGSFAGFMEIRILVYFSRALKVKFGNFETLRAASSTLIGRRESDVFFRSRACPRLQHTKI